MADAAQPIGQLTENNPTPSDGKIIYRGSQRNMAVGVGMLLSALLAFTMGMTTTYFGGAIAWTFAIWGALLLFMHLLDNYQTYELDEEKLVIRNPIRVWNSYKEWPWAEIYRMDILVRGRDTRLEDTIMHIYRQEAGDIVKQREDRELDAKLAEIVIERAGLQAVDDNCPAKIAQLPLSTKENYHWSRSGSLA